MIRRTVLQSILAGLLGIFLGHEYSTESKKVKSFKIFSLDMSFKRYSVDEEHAQDYVVNQYFTMRDKKITELHTCIDANYDKVGGRIVAGFVPDLPLGCKRYLKAIRKGDIQTVIIKDVF